MAEPRAIETGVYLLTPTHPGTGQAAGAVDLPIAREAHTQHPLLPASALKGVLRSHFDTTKGSPGSKELVKALFGPEPPGRETDERKLHPGDLVITDGLLVAFPVRSLSAPFYWITCPLVLDRWQRLRRAFDLDLLPASSPGGVRGPSTLIPEDVTWLSFDHPGPLVLEDLVFTPDRRADPTLKTVAAAMQRLLPADDEIAGRLAEHLICVPSNAFRHLVRRCTSVQARIQLTDGKTTDTWTGPNGKDQTGNLWYEETLPPDCLFVAHIGWRNSSREADLRRALGSGQTLQIGGNETVGQGQCHWRTVAEASASGAQPRRTKA